MTAAVLIMLALAAAAAIVHATVTELQQLEALAVGEPLRQALRESRRRRLPDASDGPSEAVTVAGRRMT